MRPPRWDIIGANVRDYGMTRNILLRLSHFILHPSSFILRRYSFPDRLVTIELRHGLPLVVTLLAVAWYVAAPSDVTAVLAFGFAGMLAAAWGWARAMARQGAARRKLGFAAGQGGD